MKGKHAGDFQVSMTLDPINSQDLKDETWLDYVSCSPFRGPVARIAAAHAALEHDTGPTARVLRRKTAAGKPRSRGRRAAYS